MVKRLSKGKSWPYNSNDPNEDQNIEISMGL